MLLEAHRLAVDLPRGWDGRIHARPPELAGGRRALGRPAERPAPATLHAASFALPPKDGDFGSNATASMSERDTFLAVTEYLEGNGLRAGSGLFRSRRLPHPLRPGLFSPHTLLVGRPGQAGFQHFFTAGGRPFCLYVVVGSPPASERSLGAVTRVLASLRIDERR
jgi:hypothetical protein